MATIQAQGPVSERKRIKMQGRAWKSFLRPTLIEKRLRILMLHVKSHDGRERPEQRGNDKADKIAKKLMNQAETLNRCHTSLREKFLAFHKDTLITDNIRTWVKEQELTQPQNRRKKLKVQGRLFRRFPQQILTLTKLIKNWSIERAEGKAWIFFIFAICDWLPLNYRVHSHSNDTPKTLCCLCQGNAPETTEHLFTCPALRGEHNTLRERTDRIFKKWSIPYSALGHLPNLSIKVT